LAVTSPADCFNVAIEAWRIAARYMTPVAILSDAYVANGSEPWRIPELESLPQIRIEHPPARGDGDPFLPYQRDERLARPWALPGTPGLMHRIGGLEKQEVTGAVCYEAQNHQNMTRIRAQKVAGIAQDIPLQTVEGPERGPLLVLGWGGTYGALTTAVRRVQARGKPVALAQLRYLNPWPRNLGELLQRYDKVLVAELNRGQLRKQIRGEFLIDAAGFNKMTGRPFTVGEVVEAIEKALEP
jgi:2-oxoglutarate ferredoxin oxidoreductase subunit alpha